MKIFEKLFGDKKSQEIKPQSESLNDLIFDWFNDSDLSISEFEETFLKDIIDTLKENQHLKNHIESSPDIIANTYFPGYAILFLSYHHPVNSFYEKLFKLWQKVGTIHYELMNIIKGTFDRRLSNYNLLQTASNIVKVYHAIHIKKVRDVCDLHQAIYILNNSKYSSNSNDFNKPFRLLKEAQFEDEVYLCFELYNHKNYGYSTGLVQSKTPNQPFIISLFREKISNYNNLNTYQLNFNIFEELGKYLDYKYSDSYNKAEYKKRKYLKVNDLENCSSFIQIAKNDKINFLNHLIYYLHKVSYISDQKIFAETLKQIIDKEKFSKEWILTLLNSDYGEKTSFFVNAVFTPILTNISSELSYQSTIVLAYIKQLYGQDWSYQNNIIDKNGENFLEKIYQKISDIDIRNLYCQTLNIYKVGSDFHMNTQFTLVHDNKNKKYPEIKALIEDLQVILPVTLLSVKSQNMYYHADYHDSVRHWLTLNFKQQEVNLTTRFVNEINNLLRLENTGYQLVSIPLIVKQQSHSEAKSHLSSLAFMSFNEFSFFKNQYLQQNFKELITHDFFQNQIKFPHKDAIPFYKLKESLDIPFALSSKVVFENDVNWKWFKDKYIDNLNSKNEWYGIMNSIIETTSSKKPTKNWLNELEIKINNFGEEKYFKELQVLMSDSLGEEFWYFDTYKNALKGLIWTCTYFETSDTSFSIVQRVIQVMYTKIPGVGPKSTSLGNVGLDALVASQKEEAFGILNILRNKTKYNRFVVAIEKRIDQFKDILDIPEELLADKSIPTFGFKNGVKKLNVMESELSLKFAKGKLKRFWTLNGEVVKKLPNSFSTRNTKQLKEVNEEAKQINKVFLDLKSRVKTYWLYDREWRFEDWEKYLLKHPLMSSHLQSYIWENRTQGNSFIVLNNQLYDIHSKGYKVEPGDKVKFWHPINNTEEDISSWQSYIWQQGIKQTERQAFREHYPFSENELSSKDSLRFAHHFLEVRKLMAISNSAGWIFTYVHEGVNWPRKYVKSLNLTVHLRCDYDRNDFAIPTKELFFTQGDSTKINDHKLKLENIEINTVPKATLSEICRDIDLFIATTSISNNPQLSKERQELNNYRLDYEKQLFSENASSKIRRKIINQLIPILGLSSNGFEGNYLIVNGKINQYRINLSSGFAQTKETHKHINIIPSVAQLKKDKKLRLPIEDDDTLYIILAKALYLQNDSDISEESIRLLITS